jgi:hypothetical protein
MRPTLVLLCLLGLGLVPGWAIADDKEAAPPTYCKDVASIVQKHCLVCHRRGQVGPFGLETYEQARKRASDIASVVEDRIMPSWKAAPHFGVPLKGDKSLSEREIATLVDWAEGGAPEGNRGDLPAPPEFPDDWALGTPDLIVDTGADFAVRAAGEDIHRKKDQDLTRPGEKDDLWKIIQESGGVPVLSAPAR